MLFKDDTDLGWWYLALLSLESGCPAVAEMLQKSLKALCAKLRQVKVFTDGRWAVKGAHSLCFQLRVGKC